MVATDTARVDFLAGERHFADHLLPVWRAMPPDRRGQFYAAADFAGELPGVVALPPAGKVEGLELVVVAAIGDVKRAPGARMVLMEHGAGQSYGNRHSSYVGGMGRRNLAAVLVPNHSAAGRHRRHYPAGPVAEVVGCPKLDPLAGVAPKPRGTPPVVAVSWHWHPAEPFVPEVGSAWPEVGPAILAELIALRDAGTIDLIGHAHPRAAGAVFPAYRRAGVPIAEHFDDVLERADVYAVDNSSTLFEFAFTGRPVIVINAPSYRRIVHHGLRFWKAATIGPNVDRPQDVAGAVALALEDGPALRRQREAAVDLAYSVRDGTASARAAMAILSNSNAGAALAAGAPIPNPPKGSRVLRTYRTHAGDFRYSEDAAITRGLIPGPSGLLPRAVALRLRKAGARADVVELIAQQYVKADDVGKAKALADLALTTDNALRGMVADLAASIDVGDVEAPAAPEPPAPEPVPEDPAPAASSPTTTATEVAVGPPIDVPTGEAAASPVEPVVEDGNPTDDARAGIIEAVKKGRVGDVVDAVGQDPDLARFALALERDARARPRLIMELEKVAG